MGEGLCPRRQGDLPMTPSDLQYTTEEELIADQFARNSYLVSECDKHPGSYYRTYSRLETIERIDQSLHVNGDKLLALINRNELQKKALIMIVLRRYFPECPVCRLN
jgi:hypothetical protein